MAENDQIPIPASVWPTGIDSGGGEHATHLALYGKGGLRTVADRTARDALVTDAQNVLAPGEDRLENGMLVYIEGLGVYDMLQDDDAPTHTTPVWIEDFFGSLGGGITKVADQTARDALTPTEGDYCYQEDVKILWIYRSNAGLAAKWHAAQMYPVEDTLFGGGFDVAYYYVDAAGDDNNDGRSLANAKATWGGVVADLNDAGQFTGPQAFGFYPYVQVFFSPGTYTVSTFRDGMITANIPGGVYLIGDLANFANTQAVTTVTDNGQLSTCERSTTTSAFTTFARGSHCAWSGFSVFPTWEKNPIASTTPDLRQASTTAAPAAINLEQYEVTINLSNGAGLGSVNRGTPVFAYGGIEVDVTSAGFLSALENFTFYGSRLSNSGGATNILMRAASGIAGVNGFVGSHVDIGSATLQVQNETRGDNQFIIQGTDMTNCTISFFSGGLFWNGGFIHDGLIQMGGFGASFGSYCYGQLNHMENRNASAGPILRFNSACNVRHLSPWEFTAATGTLVQVLDGAQVAQDSLGDIIAVTGNPGPALDVQNAGRYLRASNYTGIVTTPAGEDITVGANAVAALGTLPANDFAAGAGAQGARAD